MKTAAFLWSIFLLTSLTFAQSDAPTTAPAPAAALHADANAPAADLCKGVIDPYDSADQRTRFLKAAGPTNELDEKSFEANRGKPDSFVQPFDRWKEILKFDKNGNGAIDWFEADAYRQDLRKRILDKFDESKLGRLAGDQRDHANRALAGGAFFSDTAASGPAGPWAADPNNRRALASATQPAAGQPPRQNPRQAWQAVFDDWALRHFPAGANGELDANEIAALAQFKKQVQDVFTSLMARNGPDPNASPEQREQIIAEWRQYAPQAMKRMLPYIDTDGSGKITPQNWAAYNDRFLAAFGGWLDNSAAKYGDSGNPRLNDAQRAEFVKGLRQDLDDRFKKFDTDSRGRLNPEQTINMVESFLHEIGITPVAPPAPDEQPQE